MATGTKRKVYRSRSDKILGGVCGGLAEYFNIDSLIVRAIWILLVFMTNWAALLIYVLAWILVPAERSELTWDSERRPRAKREITPQHRGLFVGVVLLVVGVFALVGSTTASLVVQLAVALGLLLLGFLAITGVFKNGFNAGNGR